jgi:hypothetical protein
MINSIFSFSLKREGEGEIHVRGVESSVQLEEASLRCLSEIPV